MTLLQVYGSLFSPAGASYLVAAEAVPEIALAPGFVNWPNVTLPVFVAMMFGGTLGGNAMLIGASANVVAVGICASRGRHVSFVQFLRIGLPIAAVPLSVRALYVLALASILDWSLRPNAA